MVGIGPAQQTDGAGRQDIEHIAFLFSEQVFVDGIVFAYSTYVSRMQNFRFQIWRPVGNDTDVYELISERVATPTITGREDVSTDTCSIATVELIAC